LRPIGSMLPQADGFPCEPNRHGLQPTVPTGDSRMTTTAGRFGGGSLLGSTLTYTLANVLSAGIPFLMLPVLTRVLSPEGYGKVGMFSVVLIVLSAFTGLNVHGAVGIRYFNKDKIDYPRYVASCLLIIAVSTAVVLGLVSLFPRPLEVASKLPEKWLLVAVVVSCAQILIQTQLGIWQSAKRPLAYGGLRLSQSITDGSVSLLLVLGLGLGWQGRLAGMSAAAIVSAGIALLMLVRGRWVRFPADPDYVRAALRFGIPLVPHVIGGMLLAMVDRILISNVLDVSSTGIYMVALQIGMVLGLATDAFNRAYAPWLLETLGKEAPRRDVAIVRFTYLYFLVVVGIAVALAVLAPAVLGILVGTQFRAAAPIVVYITVGFAFGGMYYMVTNYVFFAGRTGSLAVITTISGVSNALLTYWLLHRDGLVGAARAFMLAQVLMFAGTWWLAQRSRPMPWRKALFAARTT
jgi:O-antigen/teichoic acid export membrane protein